MLGEDAADLAGGEVLAVLADPVVGAAVEEEEAATVDDQHVAEVAGVIDAVAELVGVGLRVVEVALEEAGIGGDAADLADALLVVEQLAVGPELRRRALFAAAGRGSSPPRRCTSPTLPRGSPLRRKVLIAASVEP